MPITKHISLSSNVLFFFSWLTLFFFAQQAFAFSASPTSAKAGSFADTATAESREGLYISATFDSNGRLWRLIPTNHHIYIDYSDNLGKSYSEPIQVTSTPIRIKAVAEDRPSIAVDDNGRIFIAYFTNEKQPWTTRFTYSDDGGKSFSSSIYISDHAEKARHYQDQLLVSPSGRLYHFWYDERNKHDDGHSGATLYFATTDKPETLEFENHPLKDSNCECCRMAIDFDTDGFPVIFSRFLLPGSFRDHGLLKVSPAGIIEGPTRVTEDLWKLHACPEHGPSLSIAENGRYHMTWFTYGKKREGLFYAWTDDYGETHSEVLRLGNLDALPSNAYVKALNGKVAVVWKEFDGKTTTIQLILSNDNGTSWSTPVAIATSDSASDHPFLISNGEQIFLSWNSLDKGYQLISID